MLTRDFLDKCPAFVYDDVVGFKDKLGGMFGKKSEPGRRPSPSDAMRSMRLQLLTTSPETLGLTPTPRFPKVAAVSMELPMGRVSASLVAACDGTTSLYTTGNFGVVGAGQHESIRALSSAFLDVAQSAYDRGAKTTDFGYASGDEVRFLLVGYDGVRVVSERIAALNAGTSPEIELWGAGQRLLTQIRVITEGQMQR